MTRHYSFASLVKEGLNRQRGWEPAWREPAPRASYDAIIVGGGGHGLGDPGEVPGVEEVGPGGDHGGGVGGIGPGPGAEQRHVPLPGDIEPMAGRASQLSVRGARQGCVGIGALHTGQRRRIDHCRR